MSPISNRAKGQATNSTQQLPSPVTVQVSGSSINYTPAAAAPQKLSILRRIDRHADQHAQAIHNGYMGGAMAKEDTEQHVTSFFKKATRVIATVAMVSGLSLSAAAVEVYHAVEGPVKSHIVHHTSDSNTSAPKQKASGSVTVPFTANGERIKEEILAHTMRN